MLRSRKLVAALAAGALAAAVGVGAAAGAKKPHAPGLLLRAAAQYLQLDRATLAKDLRSGQTLAQLANARGKSVNGLEAAMVAAVRTKLDAAVSAGRLTSTREQQVLARVQDVVNRLVNAKLAPRPRAKARLLGVAAAYIGVKPKALVAELKGKSLAQVATAHGKTAAGLKTALLQPFKARLDKAVAAGRVSSGDAQARLARISARLDALISKTR
jgi:lambda repressor-like predicted transcriptional regulator